MSGEVYRRDAKDVACSLESAKMLDSFSQFFLFRPVRTMLPRFENLRLPSACVPPDGTREKRLRRVFAALSASAATTGIAFSLSGCSVVHINGSLRTTDDGICVVRPEKVTDRVHDMLIKLLDKKGFAVVELSQGADPGACPQTIVYNWAGEQYYVPALVKQYAINIDLYVNGEKYANASFDPSRNLVSTHSRYIPFSRYLARMLDRLFPGRTEIGR